MTAEMPLQLDNNNVVYTYDVIWKDSAIVWASRWDIYLSMDNAVPDKVWPSGLAATTPTRVPPPRRSFVRSLSRRCKKTELGARSFFAAALQDAV